jgi:raffinose/stachyose/melibiose transport system substrate-binding protein
MKRTISILLALVMILALAACGSGAAKTESTAVSADGSETVSGKITYLTNRTDLDTDGTYAALIAKFNEEYPDVTVEVQSITDYAGELATRMQTTEYGDVLMIPDAVPSTAFSKYFEPFGTVEELSDKYQEGYLYSKWYDGQVYGLAYMCTVQGIVYNKAVFEEAGITELPKTPDEFLDCLQKIKDNTDAIPYYTNANSGWTLDQWEDHAFGTVTGNANYKNNELPNDKAAFDEGSSHYVIAKLVYDIVSQGLCESDPTTCDWEASKLMLNNGEIGCMVLGSWALSQMKEAGDHPDDVGYMPFPYSIDGQQYATSGTDYCYAINKNTKNMAAAKAFVQFMVDESGLATAQGGISLLKDDPMPDGLEAFSDVTFVVDKPAADENIGKYDEVQQESGITLYDNGQRLNGVVDIARGVSTQTFEDYMKDLSAKWAAAIG